MLLVHLRDWLCKQDTNGRRYWGQPFVQDRDDKSISQNVILELSSDRGKFYSSTQMTPGAVDSRNVLIE
jgi:hypothetical protein